MKSIYHIPDLLQASAQGKRSNKMWVNIGEELLQDTGMLIHFQSDSAPKNKDTPENETKMYYLIPTKNKTFCLQTKLFDDHTMSHYKV